jgi:hypothetical protein
MPHSTTNFCEHTMPNTAQPMTSNSSLNPIQAENQKKGTDAWKITQATWGNEITGYASNSSVTHGDTLDFFVQCTDSSFSLTIYRLGWYGGKGGREMQAAVVLPGKQNPWPDPDPTTGMVECNWTPAHRLTIPAQSSDNRQWVSGVYLAKLTSSTTDHQTYIHFVVRDDNRPSKHIFQCSVTTYQAYNSWGGKSLYGVNSTDNEPAIQVSFNRPYSEGNGAGQFFSYEHAMLRYLEKEGFDVSYCTNIDTHQGTSNLQLHRNFLSVGHDEYWSHDMRRNIENARDEQGMNLCFFSANSCYWQIRMEPSALTSAANRTMVCYKTTAPDPAQDNPDTTHLTTVRWRDAPLNQPENALIGVMYDLDYGTFNNQHIVVSNSNHWVFEGTSFGNGDCLFNLLGYEGDRIYPDGPSGLVTLASSPVAGCTAPPANMTLYQTANGAQVFAVGSIQWSCGLDDVNEANSGIGVSLPAQQITRNVLSKFGP